MLMLRDVGVAGFIDHVNSLAYCAYPFTIERHETYHRAYLALLDAVLNADFKDVRVGILWLGSYVRVHDAIFTHHCALLILDQLT